MCYGNQHVFLFSNNKAVTGLPAGLVCCCGAAESIENGQIIPRGQKQEVDADLELLERMWGLESAHGS